MDSVGALKLLKGGPKGIEEWNRRRASHERIPSLKGVDLAGADLRRANLSETDLCNANLAEVNLRKGSIFRANLVNANLKGANLGKAFISWADLREADLSHSDLTRAKCYQADLAGANLSHSKLIGLRYGESNFGGATLTHADMSDADLYLANFCKAALNGANLGGTDLLGANLIEADLTDADLIRTDLSAAKLSAAKLVGAKLCAAELRRADLSRADLRKALLHEADFTQANLGHATLDGAACGDTIFVGVDLSTVEGLNTVEHRGPSIIGTDTLFLSKGLISEAFLRGCGVPDALIEYMPSLISSMQPVQFYSCFISHSSKDLAFAERLYSRMVKEKLRVWYAPEDMRGGRKSVEQIDQAIRVYDKVLLSLSKASMASDWVLHEIRRALDREKSEKRQVLFPIGLASRKAILAWSAFDSDSGRDLAQVVREYHIPDFSNWKDHDSFERSFARLLDDLKAEKSTGPDAPTPRASRRKKPR